MTDQHSTADVFDDKAAAWATWQAEPWGRLRYELVAHTLTQVLPERSGPLRVIDVGGGDGADSIPLARAGHQVTIVDHAGELLKVADTVAAAGGLRASVRTICADLDDLEELQSDGVGVGEAFDVVLCHNVIHYRRDVAGTVQQLVRLLRGGGIVSVMAPNPAMDVLSAAVRRSDPQAALDVLDAETVHGQTFDHPMRRVEAGTVEAALVGVGCQVEHRFGIRCVMDLLVDDDLKRDPDFYGRLARLERVVCEREPFWRLGRFWQVTARRAS
ncbi:methyltransferase domain-containing protein [Kineococcus sp. NBC_00420]|uniref:methyltransferase domain-containing protein n=1 Tax=Kineococcus sp. NBC_00420 TaxID=2903564 RepID=UPI002E24D882